MTVDTHTILRKERLDFHLLNWSRWMHSSANSLDFVVSPWFQISGATTFEDMIDEMDVENAIRMDSLIDSLDELERHAIYADYLNSSWSSDLAIEPILVRAKKWLLGRLDEKQLY